MGDMQVVEIDGETKVVVVHPDPDDPESSTSAVLEVFACRWFAACDNDAVMLVNHPILGEVPVCERCKPMARP